MLMCHMPRRWWVVGGWGVVPHSVRDQSRGGGDHCRAEGEQRGADFSCETLQTSVFTLSRLTQHAFDSYNRSINFWILVYTVAECLLELVPTSV